VRGGNHRSGHQDREQIRQLTAAAERLHATRAIGPDARRRRGEQAHARVRTECRFDAETGSMHREHPSTRHPPPHPARVPGAANPRPRGSLGAVREAARREGRPRDCSSSRETQCTIKDLQAAQSLARAPRARVACMPSSPARQRPLTKLRRPVMLPPPSGPSVRARSRSRRRSGRPSPAGASPSPARPGLALVLCVGVVSEDDSLHVVALSPCWRCRSCTWRAGRSGAT